MTTNSKALTEQFLHALIANDPAKFETVLDPDATIRLYTAVGTEIYRSLKPFTERLTAESINWPDPTLEIISQLADGNKTAVEFRIQATENGRFVELNRSAFLTIIDERIKTVELYCAEPIPSAHRKNHIASSALSDDELGRLLETNLFHHDIRNGVPSGVSGRLNLRSLIIERNDPHPKQNSILGIRWAAEETEANIQAILEHFRAKNSGFLWNVSNYDTPTDLAQRLESHGLVLAGEQSLMALTNLENLQIRMNPALEIIPLDINNDEQIETAFQTISIAFNRSPALTERRRQGFFEIVKSGSQLNYLAYLNNRVIGHGRLDLSGSTAHLSGAATLPDFRGQGVYTSLLRHRLEVARESGYQIATIDAQPMSKPIVARYGFKEYDKTYIYAWMPIIDMDIIKDLIQTR